MTGLQVNPTTPKVSVIVPVYKTEQYLPKCIESILAQTFTDFELLLIDDGSPDRSGAICDEYAAKDKRIRVFHKENGGVSSARNLGLDHARGEWIAFVDSDDIILPNSMDGICNYLSIHEIDVAVFNSFSFNNIDCDEINPFPRDFSEIICSGIEMFQIYRKGSVWGAAYRRKFLIEKNIAFNCNIVNGEDTLFFSMCMIYANSMGHFPVDVYVVNERPGSASRSWTADRLLLLLNGLTTVRDLLKEAVLNDRQKSILHFFVYCMISSSVNEFFKMGKFDRNTYEMLRRKAVESGTLPINLYNVPCCRFGIMLMNYNFNFFSFFMFVRRCFLFVFKLY